MDRCSACSGEFHVILGDGPSPCRALLLAERPGKTEQTSAERNELGMVLIGDAGKELNEHYACLAGLSRGEDIYCSNVVKCFALNNRKPTSKEVAACSQFFLPGEIEAHQPKIIVLMGGTACSLVPWINLETHHGYPFKAELFGKERWVFVTYHPAAGMHDTSLMTELMQDFENLGKVLGGQDILPKDEYPTPEYEDLTGRHEDLEYILDGACYEDKLGFERIMARDTETVDGHAWCSTFTTMPGTGYMIRAVDKEGIAILGSYLHTYYALLHNALFDLPVEAEMGLPAPGEFDYVDTMQLAYHQTDLPLGLKPLGWRLCGMVMQDYDDVVMPYSRATVLEWLEEAYDIAASENNTEITRYRHPIAKKLGAFEAWREKYRSAHPNTGLETGDVIQEDGKLYWSWTEIDFKEPVLAKNITRIHTHTSKPTAPGATRYSPWKSWTKVKEKYGEEFVRPVVDRLGIMPMAGIDLAFSKDPATAIRYACMDSDATRRIYPVLLRRREKYHGKVVERDYDK